MYFIKLLKLFVRAFCYMFRILKTMHVKIVEIKGIDVLHNQIIVKVSFSFM
jgi:hypothetical protein